MCDGGEPMISVAIPTKNRPDDLERAVRSILSQTRLPEQLIVVDQSRGNESSTRIHACLAGSSIRLEYIHNPSITGASAARNRALDILDAGIVLFLDDDVILERDFIEQILAVYQAMPDAAGVSGIVTNYSAPPRPFRWWSRVFMRGPFRDDRQPVYWRAAELRNSRPLRVTRMGAGLMSFRLDAIRGVRFDENLTGACEGEDVDFCWHLGPDAPLWIAPAARLDHHHSPRGRKPIHWLFLHVRTMWYLHLRNPRRDWHARICFAWLGLGHLLAAVMISARRGSLHVWRDVADAVSQGRALAGYRPPAPPRPGVTWPA